MKYATMIALLVLTLPFGVAIAQEALSSVMEYSQGVYIMPPFGKVGMAIDTAAVIPGRKTLTEVKKELEQSQ